MQHLYKKEIIELSLAGYQSTEFFYQFLFYLYEKIQSTPNRRISRITRSSPDSFVWVLRNCRSSSQYVLRKDVLQFFHAKESQWDLGEHSQFLKNSSFMQLNAVLPLTAGSQLSEYFLQQLISNVNTIIILLW